MDKKIYQRKKKPKTGDYSGILLEPIIYHPITAFHSQEDSHAVKMKQLVEKMQALYTHYKIDPQADDAFTRLFFCLAARHVPGFKVKDAGASASKTGSPPKWTEGTDGLQLCIDVMRHRDDKGKIPDTAFKKISKMNKYKNSRGEVYNPKTLKTRYHQAKREHPTAVFLNKQWNMPLDLFEKIFINLPPKKD